MSPAAHSKEGEKPNQEALVARLRRFIDDSDLSFYRIALLIGTSGTFLSMWLARAAKPKHSRIGRGLKDFFAVFAGRKAHEENSTRGPAIRAPEARQPSL